MSITATIVPSSSPFINVNIAPNNYTGGSFVGINNAQSTQETGNPTVDDLKFVYNSTYPNSDATGPLPLALPTGFGGPPVRFSIAAIPVNHPINPVILTPTPKTITTVVTDTTYLPVFH